MRGLVTLLAIHQSTVAMIGLTRSMDLLFASLTTVNVNSAWCIYCKVKGIENSTDTFSG
jgi:hypothetical protein